MPDVSPVLADERQHPCAELGAVTVLATELNIVNKELRDFGGCVSPCCQREKEAFFTNLVCEVTKDGV